MADDEEFDCFGIVTMFLDKETRPSTFLNQVQDHYLQEVNQMKANIRDVPLKYLIALSGESGNITREIVPDITPERKAAILTAKREIHRRAFKGFTVVPSRKFDAAELGFLRKPKF